jgi:hypothetical protein
MDFLTDPQFWKALLIGAILTTLFGAWIQSYRSEQDSTRKQEREIEFDADFRNLRDAISDAKDRDSILSLELEIDRFEWYYINFFQREKVTLRRDKLFELWYKKVKEFTPPIVKK